MARLAVLALLGGPLLGGLVLAEPVPAPVSAELGPLLIQAEAQTEASACDGRDVQVEGNHNQLRLYGACRSLVLKGVANEVSLGLAAGGAIRVEGSGNRVFYQAPDLPGLVVLGPDNVVATLPTVAAGLAAPLASPATATLELSGDDQMRAVDCAGRRVAIQGQRSLYLLRGGCRSVTVRGGLLSVQAELAPGAAVIVAGHGVRVGWVLARPGRAPTVSAHGEANLVAPLPSR